MTASDGESFGTEPRIAVRVLRYIDDRVGKPPAIRRHGDRALDHSD